MNADDALHVRETADDLAVDVSHHVADLKARGRGGAIGFDLVDARRRARLAEEGEQAGEDHDRKDEIRNWAGGDDRRTRTDLLVMERARLFFRAHAGERFGRWRRGFGV